jgi:hypothetical protein
MKRKSLVIVFGILVAILAIAYFQFDSFVERAVRNKLTFLINQSPDKLYEYEFDNLNINLIDGSLTLHKVGLIPTQHAIDSVKSAGSSLRAIMAFRVDKIEMNGFEIRKFLNTGDLQIEDLLILRPEFKLLVNPDKKIKATKKAGTFDEILTDKFTVAELNSFNIINATFSVANIKYDTNPLIIDSINFVLKNARADQETIEKFIPFEFSDFSFTSTGIHMDFSSDFTIESDKLEIDAALDFVKIFNFQIRPKLNFKAFSARYNMQKQWFALVVDELHLHRFNLDQLYTKGDLLVEKLEIFKANAALYKDKSKPAPPFKVKPLPATIIRNIPFKIDIDSVIIENAMITINEKSGLTGKISNLTFSQLNAVMVGFSNDSLHLSENPVMSCDVSTNVMNQAKVQMRLAFNLLSDSDEFTVSGQVDSVKAGIFNEVLVQMMAVEVKSGDIHRMDFEFIAMDTISKGTLDMEYNNVKIDILNPDLDKTKKQGFRSLAANTVIKTHNRKTKPTYAQGVINVARVREKDVFPYLWHSIQSGLVSTLVPVTNKKEAKQQQKQARKKLKQNQKKAEDKR